MSKNQQFKNATYVPNRDIKELSLVLHNELKKIKGTDILDGVYVKASQNDSKTTAETIYKKMLDIASDAKIEKSDLAKIKKTDIKKLMDVGYDSDNIQVIYFGVLGVYPASCDTEISDISGIFALRDDYVDTALEQFIKVGKSGKFELGLKYPDFNWKSIIDKYSISQTPKYITKSTGRGDRKYTYEYEVYSGNKIVVGHQISYSYTAPNSKPTLNDSGEKVGNPNKQSKYQKDRSVKAGFNSGYWGIVSSNKAVLIDVLQMLFKQSDGYVKDAELFINGLGGIYPSVLDSNNIKYKDGGNIADEIPNNYVFKTPPEVWEAWSPLQRVHFVEDHKAWVEAHPNYQSEVDDIKLSSHAAKDMNLLSGMSYNDLSFLWKNALYKHVSEGQYEKGGKFKSHSRNDIEHLLENLTDEKFAQELSTDNLLDYKIDSDTTDDGRGTEMAVIWLEIQNPKPETLEIVARKNGYKELILPFEKWAKENSLSLEGLELTTTDEAEPKIIISVTEYVDDEYEGGGVMKSESSYTWGNHYLDAIFGESEL